jgi:hypothetical protein
VGPGFGADVSALATAVALFRIYETGLVADVHPKHRRVTIPPIPLHRRHLGIGQEANAVVQIALKSGAKGGLAGQHEADAAGVGGESVVKEVHGATDGRRAVEESNLVAQIGKVQGGGHTGDAPSNDEYCLAVLTCCHS